MAKITLAIKFLDANEKVIVTCGKRNLKSHWEAAKLTETLMAELLKRNQNAWLNWDSIDIKILREKE